MCSTYSVYKNTVIQNNSSRLLHLLIYVFLFVLNSQKKSAAVALNQSIISQVHGC